tara:strand:+ start:106 stop:1380 length:1275 start_codon:yes stop_codon:yes gene_type:complete
MAAVTWKNIAPSNPSGLLNAANQAAQSMGQGISGIGTALQSGVDKKVESETNDFITDLMAAGSEEERNAMIGAANQSFLNLDTVNKTNYELGAPERELETTIATEKRAMTDFTTQLGLTEASQIKVNNEKEAAEFASLLERYKQIDQPTAKDLAAFNLQKQQIISDAKVKQEEIKGKKTNTGYGSDPIENGYFKKLYGWGEEDSWMKFGLGAAFDQPDVDAFVASRNKFVTKFQNPNIYDEANRITMEEFNDFVNRGFLRFADEKNDDFYFNDLNGEPVALEKAVSNAEGMAKLQAAIMATKGNTTTQDAVDATEKNAWSANNPLIVDDPATKGINEQYEFWLEHGKGKGSDAVSDELLQSFLNPEVTPNDMALPTKLELDAKTFMRNLSPSSYGSELEKLLQKEVDKRSLLEKEVIKLLTEAK